MTDQEFPEGYGTALSVVVYKVWKRYSKWIDREDMLQEAWVWSLNRKKTIDEAFAEPDEDARRHNEKRIWWQVRRVCERLGRKEKAIKSGYATNDEYYYETTTIAQMLPHILANVFDGVLLEQAQQVIDDGTPKRPSAPSEGRNLLAMLIDIKKGYELLGEDEKQVLTYRYHHNLTLQQMAEVMECSKSTADRRCENALRVLQRLLGGDNPWS